MTSKVDTIFGLSPAEKLQLVEDRWDDLAADAASVPVHAWQIEELAKRKANLMNNPAPAISWQQAKQMVRLFTLTLLGLACGLLAAAPSQPTTKPAFVTSDPDAMWNDQGYIVHNNMWNAKKYRVAQTLRATAHDDWQVTASADDSRHEQEKGKFLISAFSGVGTAPGLRSPARLVSV